MSGGKRLALLVEDSRMTRRVIREMLESLDFFVVETSSLAEARRWVAQARTTPSLALIDWGLPDGTGLELVREWRGDSCMRQTQLLMLTIRSEREVIEAALTAGADEFLMKPCTIEALEDKLALLEFPHLPGEDGAGERDLVSAGRAPRRVLIVDDSSIARRAITMALEPHPGIELIGHAADGRAAIDRVVRDDPDVVILDIEMPGLDGLGVLEELRERSPHTAVVVFSTHTSRGASVTVDALLLGARDCLRKPEKMSSFEDSLTWMREELGRRIEAITARPTARAPQVLTPARPASRPAPRRGQAAPPELLLIASSTGGPLALRELLGDLPEQLPVPVVAVQHLPPEFIEPFVRQLDRSVAVPVEVAHYGAPVLAGRVYFAPGGAHLRVVRSGEGLRFVREDGPRIGGCRPAADVLFGSAAEHCGAGSLAVVLTGMGSDGCEGARRIVAAGGRVFAQDQGSSAVWSMPGAVVRSGLASKILPLETMAGELSKTWTRSRGER